LYAYTAQQSDELTIREDDELFVLDKHLDDSGNWWKARDAFGNIGIIPATYVQELEQLGRVN
jgi:hypothetical protein